MDLLTDVHVKAAYVTALRTDGHDVTRVVDVADLGHGATDGEIVGYARTIEAQIVTNDVKDFDTFDDHPGVIVVPQHGLTAGEVAAAVRRIERTLPRLDGRTEYVTAWL